MSSEQYRALLADPFIAERIAGDDGVCMVVVDDVSNVVLDDASMVVEVAGSANSSDHLPSPGSLPFVVCAVGARLGAAGPPAADLVVDGAHLDHVVDVVSRNPRAAVSLVVLLRGSSQLDVAHGLAAESAVYSMLQGASEFTRWRAGREPDRRDETATVIVERIGGELIITLDRPHRHNAITRQLRDELCAALAVAVADDSVAHVRLRGNGPSFCSGGDLGEFGSFTDVAVGHATRLAQSPARLIHELRDCVTVEVHGATFGGGIEMAAFAGEVVADHRATFALPEVGLGLVPGAGGTVSLPRRIGRQRTAALALATDTIDAATALEWGLVDRVTQTGVVTEAAPAT